MTTDDEKFTRYLADYAALADGSLVEIDPQDDASLAAFKDAAAEQQRRGVQWRWPEPEA